MHNYETYDVEMNITIHLKVPGGDPEKAKRLAVEVIRGIGFVTVKIRRVKVREEPCIQPHDWLMPQKLSF